jgi:VanZ family protein
MGQETRVVLGMTGAGALVFGMVELGRAGIGLGPPALLALGIFAAIHALPGQPPGRYALLGLHLALFHAVFALSASPEHWSGSGRLVLAVGCIALLTIGGEAFGRDRLLRLGWARWTALMGLALLVAWFSGGAGGPGWMVRFLVEGFGIAEETARTIAVVLRKAIHFLFYGLLALLAGRAAEASGASIRSALCFATLWTLSHALFDETRQMTAPGRTGTWGDIALDMAGAAFFLALWMRRRPSARHPVT